MKVSSVQSKTTFPSANQPNCMQQISTAALWLLKTPFSLTYYSGAWIVRTASHYLFGPEPGAISAKGNYYSRNELLKICNQTESLLKAGSYNYQGKTVQIPRSGNTSRQSTFWGLFSPAFKSKGHNTELRVVDQDGLYAAAELKKKYGHVAVLNPANSVTPGGGARSGAAAYEEDICRRSALLPELEKQHYPLSDSTLLYNENIPVFRYGKDRHYALMEKPIQLSFITSAAVNLNGRLVANKTQGNLDDRKYFNNPEAFKKETKKRAYAQLWKAAEMGANAVVLTAFGCGAFENDPEVVARIYRDVLKEKFQGVFQNVTFAIINDHNAGKKHNPRGNFSPFHDVFIRGVK